MARTQFTFTFTNAQPGSVVTFGGEEDHLYVAATGSARLGHPLILDSSNALSVWSDAETLTAMTEDGAGDSISATATRTAPSVTTDAGTAGQNPFSSGGSVVGSPCWFSGATTSLLASGASNSPVWTVNTDGVPAGTDVIVHAADHKQLECVTPGKYLVTFGSAGFETSDAQELGQYVVLNDDSVGPAYNFNSYSQVAWPNNLPTFPLVLVAGDLLKLSMSLSGATTNGDVSQANAVLIRIG